MSKTISVLVGILVILVIVAAGLLIWLPGSETPTGAVVGTESEVLIGSIMPLTGEAAKIGEAAKQVIDLAIEEVNAQGGINGKTVKVIYEDGRCGGKEAANSANKLVNVDKVQAIVGGYCSAETIAAAPLAEAQKVVMLSPCSSAPKISQAGDFIFRNYPSDAYQGKFVAEYVFNEMGKTKAAILFTNGDWGIGIKDAFKKAFAELGGEIIEDMGFEQDTIDLRTQLSIIQNSDAEVIYAPTYSQAAAIMLKQAKELGITIPILGADAAYDSAVIESAGTAAEGFKFSVIKSGAPDEFRQKYIDRFGHDFLVCTEQSYDAAKLVVEAIKENGNTGTGIRDFLYSVKDYNGISGIHNFDSNGDLARAEYNLFTVKNGEFTEYEG